MANNEDLHAAAKAKQDEFYTQYSDIEAEMNAYYEYNHDVFRDKTILCPCDDPEWSNFTRFFAQNFTRFGLKKLICTSYAESHMIPEPTLFETESDVYDPSKTSTHGKLYVLDRDTNGSGRVDVDDIQLTGYLDGDGDFRRPEVTRLRDEADIIVTNPPFSLFRSFLKWVMDGKKQFVILGNKNAITYKEVFPLLKENKMWIGYRPMTGGMCFNVPENYRKWLVSHRKEGTGYMRVDGKVMGYVPVCWLTNLDHGKRHMPLQLDTMAHNLKFNKRLQKKLKESYGDATQYPRYDNYDAIEVPFTECIPSDYQGVMGVPITFMDKYDPDQFDIIGMAKRGPGDPSLRTHVYTEDEFPNYSDLNAGPTVWAFGKLKNTYPRILIRAK